MPSMPRINEVDRRSASGYLWIVVGLVLIGVGVTLVIRPAGLLPFLAGVLLILAAAFVLAGLYMLQPNEAAILLLFGEYVGTDRSEGLRWANPFYRKQKISLRAHNLMSERLKVNDKRGNPIEIAAAVVWRVRRHGTGGVRRRGLREVRQGAEPKPRSATLPRAIAYDEGRDRWLGRADAAGQPGRRRAGADPRAAGRFDQAGIVVEDAQAHAPRLCTRDRAGDAAPAAGRGDHRRAAEDRARRGQHGRDGAARACRSAGIVNLDDERRAAMVSNLLVVLCAENDAQPVINTGTLYQ